MQGVHRGLLLFGERAPCPSPEFELCCALGWVLDGDDVEARVIVALDHIEPVIEIAVERLAFRIEQSGGFQPVRHGIAADEIGGFLVLEEIQRLLGLAETLASDKKTGKIPVVGFNRLFEALA